MEPTSLRFARLARSLAEAARAQGLRAPTFRSPPRIPDVSRSIVRRGPAPTVAVAIRGRPWAAVVAHMVEGVVAANRLTGVRADRVRSRQWEEAGEVTELAACPHVAGARRHGGTLPRCGRPASWSSGSPP